MQSLQEHLQKFIPISEQEIRRFCDFFTPKEVQKKAFLLREGEVCKFEAFVLKGLFKVFHINDKGDEQILFFAVEDWWVTDFDSFDTQTPSQLHIQALEDSQILLISKENKDKALQEIPILHQLFHRMAKKTCAALQRRMIDNLSKNADERYWDYWKKYPHIAKRLTNVQMAAYLGVSHEFVSKIRRKSVQKD